ncbi:MAG: Mpo1-like protein [Planctomyces sp.]
MIRRFLKNYLPRHRNRWNQFLHLLGVPATFVGTPWCLIAEKPWYWAAAFFAGGYFLQFAGHAIEGNDAGEVVFLKRFLGLPYTEYGHQANSSSDSDSSVDTNSV